MICKKRKGQTMDKTMNPPEILCIKDNCKNTNLNGESKKKITLNPDGFYGRVEHKNILKRLLVEIRPVNFREVIGLDAGVDLSHRRKITSI